MPVKLFCDVLCTTVLDSATHTHEQFLQLTVGLGCLWCFDAIGMWPVKNMGDGGGGHWLVRMEWCPAG